VIGGNCWVTTSVEPGARITVDECGTQGAPASRNGSVRPGPQQR
jgi:hypothetical protein